MWAQKIIYFRNLIFISQRCDTEKLNALSPSDVEYRSRIFNLFSSTATITSHNWLHQTHKLSKHLIAIILAKNDIYQRVDHS